MRATPAAWYLVVAASTAAVGGAGVERQGVLLGGGQLGQVGGQPLEPVELAVHHLPGAGVRGDDTVFETVDVGLQGGEGGAQLVGEVGHQPPSGGLGAVEAGRHAGEGGGEPIELGAEPGVGHRGGVVAGGEGVGGARELADRAGQAADHERGHRGGGGDRDQGGDDEGDPERGVERLLGVGTDRRVVLPCPVEVIGEECGCHRQRDDGEGERAGEDDEELGCEQPRPETWFGAPAGAPTGSPAGLARGSRGPGRGPGSDAGLRLPGVGSVTTGFR
jgi:hypothetical protein